MQRGDVRFLSWDKLRASEKYHGARAFLFNISQILIVPPPPNLTR